MVCECLGRLREPIAEERTLLLEHSALFYGEKKWMMKLQTGDGIPGHVRTVIDDLRFQHAHEIEVDRTFVLFHESGEKRERKETLRRSRY